MGSAAGAVVPVSVGESTRYDKKGRVVAVVFHCHACGQEWDDPDLSAALAAKTSSRGDRITKQHWDECPGKGA